MIRALAVALLIASAGPARAEVRYRVDLSERAEHHAIVEMTVDEAPAPLELAMPVWTPGAYEMRTWGRNVRLLGAVSADGRPLPARRTGPSTFRVETGRAGATVRVRYQVYAAQLSDDASQLDAGHAYLNGTSIFLIARGLENVPHRVEIAAPAGWGIATALDGDGSGFRAPSYAALVDAPIEVGRFASVELRAAGRAYRLAVDGARELPPRLASDVAKIVRAEVALAGPPPYARYLVLIHFSDELGRVAALEHAASTSIVVPRASLSPGGQAYDELVYVIAHELYHAWNARRLRPAELVPYDFLHATRSRSLYITEGFTEYYAHRAMVLAGLWSRAHYLDEVASEAERAAEDARLGLTLEEDSELTWQPPDAEAADPDAYYARGHLVALALDAELRAATSGRRSLDDLMRGLYAQAARAGGLLPVSGDVIARQAAAIAGMKVAKDFTSWIREPDEPKRLAKALAGLGLQLTIDELPAHSFAGFAVEPAPDGLRVAQVEPGGPAAIAGLRPGDRILRVDGTLPSRQWIDALTRRAPSQPIAVEALRATRHLVFELRLAAERPIRCRLAEIPTTPPIAARRSAWWSLPRR